MSEPARGGLPQKLYYRIGEVAELVGVEPHVLRYWEREFRSIHVGGTAGKGSTATMCAAILSAAGYKVGLHTKPHLHSVTERARIDGQPISEERFAGVLSEMPSVRMRRSGFRHGVMANGWRRSRQAR